MKIKTRPAILLPVIYSLAACATGYGSDALSGPAENLCRDPRPQACTMEYVPVCARLRSAERRVYPNACGACADPDVEAYSPGACE